MSYLIAPLRAEFRDAATEKAFRLYTLDDTIRHSRIALFVAAAFFLVFAYRDILAFVHGGAFSSLLASRIAVAAFGVGLALLARRLHPLIANGYGITAFEIVTASAFLYSSTLYEPSSLPWLGMSMAIIILGYYVLIPNRFVLATLASVYLTVGFVACVALYYQPPRALWAPVILHLLLANVAGCIASHRLSKLRHEEFARNEQLTSEISGRSEVEEALRKSEASLAEAQRIAKLGTWVWSPQTGETYWSAEMYRLLEYDPEEVPPNFSLFMESIHPQDESMVQAALDHATSTGNQFELEFRLVRSGGAERVVRSMGEVELDEAGKVMRVLGTAYDITEQKHVEKRLATLANYDTLTGLPNRHLFHEHLTHALAQADRHNHLVALFFLDLDDFKIVNDTLGHAVGDELLKQVASRIRSCVREGDVVARLGGDEFTIILEQLNDTNEAAAAAQQVLKAMNQPFYLAGHQEIFSGVSIGGTFYPMDGKDVGSLLSNADTAMYHAKVEGKSFQFFTADMSARAAERLRLERDLRRALASNEFSLYYQPQIDLRSGRIIGMEALLRWNHPERGMMLPSQFIPVAEESGLIVSIGEWVFRSAAMQCRAWKDMGFRQLCMSINISACQFQYAGLAQTVAAVLKETGLDVSSLVLEITESFLIKESEANSRLLYELQQIGVQFSIDDFGTGYSSLAYLKRFPISSLKIDRSFVSSIPQCGDDKSICRAIIAMAHGLGMKVIAEGIETDAQWRFFYQEGCDAIQGFLISKAVPASEMQTLLEEPIFNG